LAVAAQLLLAPLLIAASPEPVSPPPADRVFALAAPWTCRTILGSRTREVGTRSGDVVDVTNEIRGVGDFRYTLRDHYAFDAAAGIWNVQTALGSKVSVRGIAPPWTGQTWNVIGRGPSGRAFRIRYELLPGGDLRRTFADDVPGAGIFHTTGAERCSPGDVPPPADACIVENFPAQTLVTESPLVDLPRGLHGTVHVLVALDAASNIVSTRIQSSPSASLNKIALDTVRASKFQTEIRGCRPYAAQYIFSVSF
jgi:TonB-like protein